MNCDHPSCQLCSSPPADGNRKAQIADLGSILNPSKFVHGQMDPTQFATPDLFTTVGNKIYHKFDEISLFYAPAAGSMVCAFYLRGKMVYWTPVAMGSFRGELTIDKVIGWQEVVAA